MEQPEADIMRRKPRKTTDGVFAGGLGVDMAYQGLVVSILVLIAYFVGHYIESGVWEIAESPDDTASVITYEYSKTESLPKRLTTSLKTEGGAAVIELMERDGVSGNVLHLTTSAGNADQVDFKLSADGTASAGKLVFATDIYFDLTGDAKFEIYYMLGDKNASKIVFAQKSDGTVTMQYYSNHTGAVVDPNPGVTLCNAKQWVRLRIEIDMGDGTKDTLSYKTYIDETLVCESSNYWQSETGNPCHIKEISKIRFSTYTRCEGSICFDNTALYPLN
jgi:hypothetical protein